LLISRLARNLAEAHGKRFVDVLALLDESDKDGIEQGDPELARSWALAVSQLPAPAPINPAWPVMVRCADCQRAEKTSHAVLC